MMVPERGWLNCVPPTARLMNPKPPVVRPAAVLVCGLSGLTWCREDLYYAVSDRQRAIIPVRITLDRKTGLITAAKPETAVPVKTVLDRSQPPTAGLAKTTRFPAFERHVYAHGLELFAAPMSHVPLVTLALVAPAGGEYDPMPGGEVLAVEGVGLSRS